MGLTKSQRERKVSWTYDEKTDTYTAKVMDYKAVVDQINADTCRWIVKKGREEVLRGERQVTVRRAQIECETFIKRKFRLDKFNPWPGKFQR